MVSLEINFSLILQIINFLILMVALNFLLYRPIRMILGLRAKKVAGFNDEILTSESKIESKEEELANSQKSIHRQGLELFEEKKDEGLLKEKELVKIATDESDSMVSDVQVEIKEKIRLARGLLDKEIDNFGKELAGKILGRSIR